MSKPVLLVLAAGMGSRYGGLKQIDPVGEHGEVIIDYSVYDAISAGFEKVVFVIKKEIEADFKEGVGNRLSAHIEVAYAYQELGDVPNGYAVPQGRVKPWGTGHAVLAARDLIDAPFAVINSDDYYGAEAFKTLYDFLAKPKKDDKEHYAIVGYKVENTVTDSGAVTRGVCQSRDGFLTHIDERHNVLPAFGGAKFSEDGNTFTSIPAGTLVSMNFWGFQTGFFSKLNRDFGAFLDTLTDPLKSEFLLPTHVSSLIDKNETDVAALSSGDVWYGVTYKEDKAIVAAAMKAKHANGQYPSPLWGERA
ncbi:nucleotidyltransferase [Clostridia bacterium]|nr:nucleotidyltransferase [Clostridia bacterium]